MKKLGVAVIGACLLLAGCSSAPAPSETTAVSYPATYRSVEDLRDAFVSAGGDCPAWEQTNQIPLAAESGTCSSSNVLSIYSSTADRDELVRGYKSIATNDSVILVGENWVINDKSVRDLDPALGGTIVTK